MLAAGFDVMGPAKDIAHAIRLMQRTRPALAILDLNLRGQMAFPLLDALAERAIPFLILSGHSPQIMPARHRRRPFLQKPYEAAALLRVVRQVLAGDGGRPLLQRA